jgi:hypothetical protein
MGDLSGCELGEVILFLFDGIKKSGYEGATKKKILKLLYALKQELPEDHPLNKLAPFYWYLHGPYSEPVEDAFRILDGIYITKKPYNNYSLYEIDPQLNFEIEYNLDLIDSDVYKIVSKLLKEEIFFHIEEKVYRHYAPYEFMPLYKLDFLETIKDEKVLGLDKAIKIGYKSESKMPAESYYLDYEDIFSEFLVSLDRLNSNEKGEFYFSEILKESINAWNVFAQGVRVKHYESCPQYENKKSTWDNLFNESLSIFSMEIERFSDIARESSKSKPSKLSETSKKLLSSSLGTYITCDKYG